MADTKDLRDQLIGALIGLARATEGNEYLLTESTGNAVIEGLSAIGNDTMDSDRLSGLLKLTDDEKRKLVPDCYHCINSCGRTNNYNINNLQNLPKEIQLLKTEILSGICRIAMEIKQSSSQNIMHGFFYKALYSIGADDWDTEYLQSILDEMDEIIM